MKGKMKKIIAGIATLAMAAQFAFVVPVSAEKTNATDVYNKTSFASSDISAWTGTNAEITVDGTALKISNPASGANADSSAKTAVNYTSTKPIIYVDFTWGTGQSTGNEGNYNYIKIGDVELRALGQKSQAKISVAGTETDLGGAKEDVRGGTWTGSLIIDTASGEVSYDITLSKSGNKKGKADGSTKASLADFKNIEAGFHKGGRTNTVSYSTISSLVIKEEENNKTYYDVTYKFQNIQGDTITKTEAVESGQKPTMSVEGLDPSRRGYDFNGWAKDGDTENLLSEADVKNLTITANTELVAVYSRQADYIEEMESVAFDNFPSGGLLVAGADANTAESNAFSMKITGQDGTNLSENPDSRVTDYHVDYTLNGFRWVASKNEATTDPADSNTYCDSYGKLIVDNTSKMADFQLAQHGFNYYGSITATVTYHGKTLSVTKPLAYLGTASANAKQILPNAGYISDVNNYAPDMVDFVAEDSSDNTGGTNVATDNWMAYGGNSGRSVKIAEEDGKKFFKLKSTGTNSSSYAANQLKSAPTGQVIISQDVRFYSTTKNNGILYKQDNPVTWGTNATAISLGFGDSGFQMNGANVYTVTDGNVTESAFAPATGTWYHIVLAADVTSKKAYALIYDTTGETLLAKSETVNFVNTGVTAPKFLCFRTADNATGEFDFNDVKIYVPDVSGDLTTTGGDDAISIPETASDPANTTEFTINATSTEGYDIIGLASWSLPDFTGTEEPVTITPNANDSHKATLTVKNGAPSGEITVRVTLGGKTKDITVNLSSSQDSVKFDKKDSSGNILSPQSISIPMLAGQSDSYTYSAKVVDKDGAAIEGKTVTYEVYDKSNTNVLSTMPTGITFNKTTGMLTVDSTAKATTFYIRAIGTNTDNDTISTSIKVTVHGLAFDFGTDADGAVAEGYTAVTAATPYNAITGYGLTDGTPTAAGTGDIEDPDTDNLSGTFTFRADVVKGKVYNVTINYSGLAKTGYVSSDLDGYGLVMNGNDAAAKTSKGAETYVIAAPDGVIDLIFSDSPVVSSVVIEKQDDKKAGTKPTIYHVGDSTAANNGSWAYVLQNRMTNSSSPYKDLAEAAEFQNRGAGGRNLKTFYEQAKYNSVLKDIKPGDIVMFGNNGTNGMNATFKDDVNWYLDAAEAMGAKIIINSYTPHFAVGGYADCYNSTTHTFNGWRQDSYDVVVREVAVERANSDPNYIGFVEIGKNADAAFNAYVADYEANDYESADAAAQAIIACAGGKGAAPDHNHYSNGTIGCDLILQGYDDVKGTVEQMVDLLSDTPEPPTPAAPKLAITAQNTSEFVVKVDGTVKENGAELAVGNVITITAADNTKEITSATGFTVANGAATYTVKQGDGTITISEVVVSAKPSADFAVTFDSAATISGSTVTFAPTVTGTGTKAFNAYIAEYEGTALKAVKKKKITISNTTPTDTISFDTAPTGTVKAFVWDQTTSEPILTNTAVSTQQ